MSNAIGVVALARPTFDVPFAEVTAARAFAVLDAAGIATVGPRTLQFDAAAARAAMADIANAGAEQLLLLQVTFTDASMTVELAEAVRRPVAIWAFPEPRAGGRLRLNSFCGLNLALHALGRAKQPATYLYAAADAPNLAPALAELVTGAPRQAHAAPAAMVTSAADAAKAATALAALAGRRIGLVGEPPAGFDTCRFEAAALAGLAGVTVERVSLGEIFARAKATPPATVAEYRRDVSATLTGIETVNQAELDRSLTVYAALKGIAAEKKCSALAVRCWPEMFTDYGCAACGPMGMLNGAKVPAACEADVYGALTALLLQEIAGEPSWLVDIVDIDAANDSGVFWHCGSAPLAMCDPEFKPEAQIHSNRRMPLLYQFPLKPGRITIARLSQARGETRLVVGGGEVVRAPLSFTGTSAVVRFDGGAERAMRGLLDNALEHHVAIVYGDHRGALRAAGRQLGLPVLELGQP